MGLFASQSSLHGTDLPEKDFWKTALLDDTQNFVFFDTLVYPMGCWHQDKFEASEEKEPTTVDRVIQYLHVHMTDKITLDELVSVFFTSKSFLVKHFKQETGKTIIEYLNDIRIDTAKMLLITTTKSVEEIAYAVGYESPKDFARIFKSVVGISPSAFCRQQKHGQ